MNRRKLISQELLVLSKRHLKLVAEENWEEWKRVVDQKEVLYKELRLFVTGTMGREEQNIWYEIRTLEEKTKIELTRKREEAKQELIRISQGKRWIKTYGRFNKKVTEHHFSLKG